MAQVSLGSQATCVVVRSSFGEIVCLTNPPELGAFSPSMPPPPQSPPPAIPGPQPPAASPSPPGPATGSIAMGVAPARVDSYPSEVSFELKCNDAVVVMAEQTMPLADFDPPAGPCSLKLYDSYGDGWNGGSLFAPGLAAAVASGGGVLTGVAVDAEGHFSLDKYTRTLTLAPKP